jgi:hypothetical protein
MKITQTINKLFRPQPIIQTENHMEATVTEKQETRPEQMAREYFNRVKHIPLVAVIENSDQVMARVTLFERDQGQRISVEVHSGDRLELGVQELAQRFSNAKLEILYS